MSPAVARLDRKSNTEMSKITVNSLEGYKTCNIISN